MGLDTPNISPGPEVQGLREKAHWVKKVLEDEVTELGSSRRPCLGLEPAFPHHSFKAGCLGSTAVSALVRTPDRLAPFPSSCSCQPGPGTHLGIEWWWQRWGVLGWEGDGLRERDHAGRSQSLKHQT